jgi:hypothetical protein
VHRYGNLEDLGRELPLLLKEKGPIFTVLDIEPDDTHVAGGRDFGMKIRSRDTFFNKQFKEALAD